jgi:hypothetical protein
MSPANRMESLDQSGPDQRMINYVASHQGMLCGNMLVFCKGAQQLLLRTKEVHIAGEEKGPLLGPLKQKTRGPKSEGKCLILLVGGTGIEPVTPAV